MFYEEKIQHKKNLSETARPAAMIFDMWNGHFPIIHLLNCPFITRFDNDKLHSYGPQT